MGHYAQHRASLTRKWNRMQIKEVRTPFKVHLLAQLARQQTSLQIKCEKPGKTVTHHRKGEQDPDSPANVYNHDDKDLEMASFHTAAHSPSCALTPDTYNDLCNA